MRLLAPTRRTPNAKVGVGKVDSSELTTLRRTIAEYSAEANSQIAKLNATKQELLKAESDYQKRVTMLETEYQEKERAISIKASALESKIEQLEQSADADKYKKRLKALEDSIAEVEQERINLRSAVDSVESSKNAAQSLMEELQEREESIQMECEKLSDAKKLLESRVRDLANSEVRSQEAINSRNTALNDRESSLLARESEISARMRALELKDDQISLEIEEISKKNRYLNDRTAKLESLIAYYERKTGRK